jgi:multidrug resistance efflux pump
MTGRLRSRQLMVVGLALAAVGAVSVWVGRQAPDDPLTVPVERGPLVVTLTETGSLRPAQALVYRSRIPGREVEVTWLAPEGSQVAEGDLVARLDPTELEADLDRVRQELRQTKLDMNVAEAEQQAAKASLDSLATGRGALEAEEARFNVSMAERRAARLREDYQALAPLLEKGFVTREELSALSADLEQAENALTMARRRATVMSEQTVPQERQRAALDLAHRSSQIEVVRQRQADAERRVAALAAQVAGCELRAQHPGLVVYELNMSSNPVRKVRVGDRVTPSQGIVTIPEVRRMEVDASLREADLHRVQVGQAATVVLEAYPDVKLTGRVMSVGTVARVAPDRPFDGKRFDVTIELDPNQADLRPEMTARVEIQLARRPDALMVPVHAVFADGDRRVVHVMTGRSVEKRVVALGASNDTHVEVLAGLKEGERVRLIDDTPQETGPPASAIPSSATLSSVRSPADAVHSR